MGRHTSGLLSPAEKYRGKTKRRYKREHGSSTAGSEKGYNCHALPNEKGLIIYPRARKTFPKEFAEVSARKGMLHHLSTQRFVKV